jgi:hypothetical protein
MADTNHTWLVLKQCPDKVVRESPQSRQFGHGVMPVREGQRIRGLGFRTQLLTPADVWLRLTNPLFGVLNADDDAAPFTGNG